MIYCKVEDGKILEVFKTDDEEIAKLNGYTTPCEREIVKVYDGSYKFADEVTPEDFKPTLNEVKASKIEYLKSTRNTKELEPILYKGVLFDADKDSLDRLNYAIITLTATHTESIEWTTAENTDVPMTVNDLNLVIASVGNRSNQLHIIYRDLKEQVNACTTVEEVEAITWPEDQ